MKNIFYLAASICLLGLAYYYGYDLPRRQDLKLKQEASERYFQYQKEQCAKDIWSKFESAVRDMNGLRNQDVSTMRLFIEEKIENECGI